MSSLLAFVLLLVVALVFQSASALDQLPNIQYVGYSYDSLYGQPTMQSLRSPVLEITFLKGNTANISGTVFKIPDQVHVTSNQTTDASPSTFLFTTLSQVETNLTNAITFNTTQINGMFGLSQQSNFLNASSNGNYTAFTNQRVSAFEGTYSSTTASTTSYWNSYAKYMPTYYNATSCPFFKKFIPAIGTHYIRQGVFGGTVQMQSTFTTYTYSVYSVSSDILSQFNLLTTPNLTSSQQSTLNTLNARYYSKVALVGGNTVKYTPSQWKNWTSSVVYNPILVTVGLEPLSSLLPANDPRRSALDQAVYDYLSTLNDPLVEGWTNKAPMTSTRYSHGAAPLNGIVYAVGGYSAGYTSNSVVGYDTASNKWTTKASMSYSRTALAVAEANGIIYAIGGLYSTPLSYVEAYNASTNTWTLKAPMPTLRSYLAAATVNGTVYAIGGYSGSYVRTVEAYDTTTNKWSLRAPMPTARQGLAVAVLNGTIYAIGGYNGTYLSTVEIYDPVNDSWTTGPSMPTARSYLSVGTVDGTIYAVGGYNLNSLSTVEAFSPSTGWITKPVMTAGVYYAGGAVVGEIFYVVGGYENYYGAVSTNQADVLTTKWC